MESIQVHNTGKAAEYIVASQVLLRGGDVAWPAIDRGFDLIGPEGCRIQVKSSHLRCTGPLLETYPEGVYSFGLVQRGNYSAKRKRTSKTLNFSERCDVVVFWGIEHNRFWIVPSHYVDGVWSVLLGPDSSRAFEKDIPNIKDMLKLGYTQTEIGKKYGVGGSAICNRLKKAGTDMHTDTASARVRKCENAWGFIMNFPTLIPSPDVIITLENKEASLAKQLDKATTAD